MPRATLTSTNFSNYCFQMVVKARAQLHGVNVGQICVCEGTHSTGVYMWVSGNPPAISGWRFSVDSVNDGRVKNEPCLPADVNCYSIYCAVASHPSS